jgi:hypothetical protein
MKGSASKDLKLRRIQRFISQYTLSKDLVSKLVYSLLASKENLIISIDRTNWKFGVFDINIFMLGVCYKGLAFPIMFSMLKKRGNSNIQERISLINRFISLFGKECIDCILADREFVGNTWIKYLNDNNLRYYIRIRNNFKVFLPHKNETIKASWLFNPYKKNQFVDYPKIIRLDTQLCYISGCRTASDYVIIISFNKPDQAKAKYSLRWQIETCFKAMKSSGFDIEKTHLNETCRVEKLVLLIMIAFVWCYKIGIYLDEKVKPIRVCKHGSRAKSIFKYGLERISEILHNPENKHNINIFQFLSCT